MVSVSNFGFPILVCQFRFSDCSLPISVFRFRSSDCSFPISVFLFRISVFRNRFSNCSFPIAVFRFRFSDFGFLITVFQFRFPISVPIFYYIRHMSFLSASPSDNLISLTYSMSAFSVNLFGLFYF